MELFTAIGKQKVFFGYQKCLMGVSRVTRHTSIRYSSSCHTRVNMDASILFTEYGFLVINVCNHGEYYETPHL
jgi:hypothetical protein